MPEEMDKLNRRLIQLKIEREALKKEKDEPSKKRLKDLEIPHWNTLLELSVRGFDTTGLGYMGADIVLDKEHGPLLLELNARPGLAIQVANRKGLEPRLQCAEEQARLHPDRSVEERVQFAMDTIAKL